MGHESRHIKKFMGHEINSDDFHGKSMGHKNRLWRNSWVMKKIPLIHGKFRAKNNPMKFHFAVFMGHEMIFMGFSHEIHGIFIKLQFIVDGFSWMDFVWLADSTVWFQVSNYSKLSDYNCTEWLVKYKESDAPITFEEIVMVMITSEIKLQFT